MATPTTTIDALPPAATPLNGTDLLIVQQAGITSKVQASFVGTGGSGSGGGASLPPGGTTGQALVKTSNVDGAAAWATLPRWQAMTLAEYNALAVKDPNTLYVING